jgi:hypothetical protein
MKNQKTMVILLPINSRNKGVGREELEHIQNEIFDNVDDVRKKLDGVDCGIIDLSEFMDLCNNTDDDTPKDEKMDFGETWFGYVRVKCN